LLLFSAVGGMALSMSYGIRIQQNDDPFINLAETAIKSASAAASVGAFLVDVIPILKYLPEFVPGAGFQKKARIGRKLQEDFREIPYLASVEHMVWCIPFTIYTHSSHRLGLWPRSTFIPINGFGGCRRKS
jgi:hypothetical protein